MKSIFKAIFLFGVTTSITAQAGSAESKYLQLKADTRIILGKQQLLSASIQVASPTWIYVQSDGRYFPGGNGAANAYITIDGSVVSNDSYIDWTQSTAAQQHSFNVIGAKYLQAGTHTVALMGEAITFPMNFGAGSNLSILATSATAVTNTRLSADTARLDFDTSGTAERTKLQADDRITLVSAAASNTSGPIVAMASGRAYSNGTYGDAMFGIFLNNAEPGISSMTWSINDIFTGAETQAPLYSQAFFDTPPAASTVQFIASESPYYQPQDANTNLVQYKVGANSRLVTLANGFKVYGKGLNPSYNYISAGPYRRYAYVCVGTNGTLPSCTPIGSEVAIGEGQVCVPEGHGGTVMFSTKSRIQGGTADPGGTVSLYLKIDGKKVGSTGIQQLGPEPNSVSTRTIGASYLATGSSALSAGCHTVESFAKVTGDFQHLSMNADMPILWFD